MEASLREHPRGDLGKLLVKYLADAHAIESQAEQLLKRGQKIAGDEQLAELYAEHLDETRGHQALHRGAPARARRLAECAQGRRHARGRPELGRVLPGAADTPGKLCAFAYAFEHLELGGQEQLVRVAHRAGDDETVRVVEDIIAEERRMAASLADSFDRAANASLAAVGAAA